MKIAVIGAGVCGIGAAKTLKRLGHDVTVFERSAVPGGVWSAAYVGAALQSHRELYAYTDYPWPADTPDLPGAAQICTYVEGAIRHFALDVRYGHAIAELVPAADGWRLRFSTGQPDIEADFVVVAAGHYTHEKATIALDGRDRFGGRLLTEHEITGAPVFDGQRVAVIGLGKTAIDMATLALGHASEIHHVFREARWLLPRRMLGQDASRLATGRLSSYFNTSWVYPHRLQQLTRRYNPRSAAIGEAAISAIVRRSLKLRSRQRDPAAVARLAALDPTYPMTRQFRGTVLPDSYIPAVISGQIVPRRAALAGLTETGLRLADGTELAVDIVVLALGYKRPALGFLPEPARTEFEATDDGVQLYRHILHPALPRLAFAGFNHNPLHLVSTELAMLWVDAVARGDLVLPATAEMEASRLRVRDWKRANVLREPTSAYWVSAHLHNYLDVLMTELGLDPYRKTNPFKEWLGHYEAADFATVFDEYLAKRGTRRTALALDT